MNKQILKSLKLQMFCAVLLSFFVASVVFGISFFIGNIVLDQTVYGRSFAQKMTEQQFSKLQDYAEEEEISVDNLQRLNVWCSRGEKVYLTIYQGNVLIYEFPASGDIQNQIEVLKFDPEMEDPENEYILILQENVKVRTFLYYYAGDAFYFGVTIVSGIIAFVVFSLCFIALINRKIAYISLLRQELDILSGGQLGYAVTVNGNDELGELASGIDQMRCSIIRHQEIESQIRTANSELITAMSHDLRTPLTSLLGYLELIERKKYSDEEQMYNLIHKSVEQTMRIKNMADKLFEYFYIYATEWECSEMQIVDADEFFCQVLEDYAYSLENKELVVERAFSQVSGKIAVNIELLQRVLDNLYSNLVKYADKDFPIQLSYKKEDNCFVLIIVNKIGLNRETNDSTSIGLNTCSRIVKCHGGRFIAEERENVFYIKVCIPLK